jgi:hypothetical protein
MKGIAAFLKITTLIVVQLQNSKPFSYHEHFRHVLAQAPSHPTKQKEHQNARALLFV